MIALNADRLPADLAERHALLRTYFCDKDATATASSTGWDLTLAWPDGDDRHVDAALDQALEWWGDAVHRGTMALAQRRAGRILRCLYDSWTLHSWSEWWARRGAEPLTALTILHADDHRDLASPRLFRTAAGWYDPIAGAAFDVMNPVSVRQAIESGAVGMGSFLTPFLHAAPTADVRHLCQPPKTVATTDYEIVLDVTQDDLLSPGAERPSIELRPSDMGPGPGRYRQTPHMDAWLEAIGPGPILLHIDMDYFNNRYDGDSDWRERVRLDPSVADVNVKIDELISALRSKNLLARLEDIVIAYSPGFFPAELWADADARLGHGLVAEIG